jgi:hypothetical protein
MSRRGGRGRHAAPLRYSRPARLHPAELDPNPAPPLPPGTVILTCGETGDVVGDVLEADNDDGWWPHGLRYDFALYHGACSGDHVHEPPTQDEIAARVAEAKRLGTVIQHRVKVKR